MFPPARVMNVHVAFAIRRNYMPTFTIDAEHKHQAVRNGTSKTTDSVQTFGCAKELEKDQRRMAGFPVSGNLEQLCRSRAVRGIAGRKAVHQPGCWGDSGFGRRSSAYCQKGKRCRSRNGRNVSPPSSRSLGHQNESEPKRWDRKKVRTRSAIVIAFNVSRAKGATLAEIMETTGWQKHTVRGFVSNLGNTGGETIESLKNALLGERTYRISK